ncbi:hypothetical protein HS088_TW21G00112 [Tripterygium wilfordii]|uniref:START domain-containing protein n=1 Tax=Tripterygium wilfordii TaxID=458696 RepID=A0A7J7C1I1_TRIWF|nr:hypothetical protein HS088_TW21G00112 [Tripterygium wilfordii]
MNWVRPIGLGYSTRALTSSAVRLGLQPQQIDDEEYVHSPQHIISPPRPPHQEQSPYNANTFPVDSDPSTSITLSKYHARDLLMAVSMNADTHRKKVAETVLEAMEELREMALLGAPLWINCPENSGMESLNRVEYLQNFCSTDATMEEIMKMVEVPSMTSLDGRNDELPNGGQQSQLPPLEQDDLKTEASRETGFVRMSPVNLVELLMDVMSAEFHIPTALVSSRECHFARYCKQLDCATWGVVDVSLEDFTFPLLRYKRKPSGCLIQETLNGGSKVTWVEHVQANNRSIHSIFEPIISSGFAFSAQRWVATLVRHCERISALTTATNPLSNDGGKSLPKEGRESLLKLAERLTRTFCVEVNASTENIWKPLCVKGAQDIKVMIKNSINIPGKPPITTIIFTTSLQLPSPPKRVFDFLRDEKSRSKWDLLSRDNTIEEVAHIITTSKNPENRVSIIQVDACRNRVATLYLQESFTDPTGSYIVYAPMDIRAMSMILNGGNADSVFVLPSGFAVLPDRAITANGKEEECGSLLTIAYHIVDDSCAENCVPRSSTQTMKRIIKTTANWIREAVAEKK